MTVCIRKHGFIFTVKKTQTAIDFIDTWKQAATMRRMSAVASLFLDLGVGNDPQRVCPKRCEGQNIIIQTR